MRSNHLNILLVEDSPTDTYTVQRVLERHMRHPNRVIHAETMEAALTVLQDEKIDVILLDLGLPDTAGREDTFARISRAKDDIPVIILTCLSDHDLAVEIVADGAADYVRKSVVSNEPQLLCDAIDFALCRKSKLGEIKAKINEELEEKDKVINWLSGGYSL